MKVLKFSLRKRLFILPAIAITAGCASVEQQAGPTAVPEIHQVFARVFGMTPNTVDM